MNIECVFLYLHGFASGPSSSKASYFKRKLSELGVQTIVPDLNGADFEKLTLTGQLELIDESVARIPDERNLVIIGSSMGGLLASIAAGTHKRISALILLAPGFGLNKRWHRLVGEAELSAWHSRGFVEVFHHAYGRKSRLDYGFYLDALRHQTEELSVETPTLVLHGRYDESVPVEESIAFASSPPHNKKLIILESDHQLLDRLDEIWFHSHRFLRQLNLLPSATASGA